MKKLIVLCFALFAVLTTSETPAQAQQSSAIAEALFQQGRDLMKADNFAEACPKFKESQRLEPKLGTLLNLAICNDKIGKHATSWAQFSEAAALAKRSGLADREQYARDQKSAVAAKLTHIVIKLGTTAQGLVVTLDGQRIEGVLLGSKLPIDAGGHRLVANAPGKKEWSKSIIAPAGPNVVNVTIPMLETDDQAPPIVAPTADPTAGPVPAAPPPAPPSAADQGSDYTWLVWTGFVIGGAGFAVGSITGAITLADAGDIKDSCINQKCPAEQADALSSATTTANISNVGFAIGAVGVLAGIIGLALDDDGESGTALIVGPGNFGVRGSF